MLGDPVKCIADFSFYKEIPKKTLRQTAGYLAYLGLIYAAAVMVALTIHLRPKIKEAVNWASETIPPMTLAEGRLKSSVPGPTTVRHPASENLGVVIDTDRAEPVTMAEMAERKVLAYLTGDKIYIVDNRAMKVYDLSKAKNENPVEIDRKFYESIGSVLTLVLYPAAFAVSWLVFFFWKHLSAGVYTLLALLINAGIGGGQEAEDLYKLSVYAQTPVVALQMAALIALKPIPLFGVLAFLVVGVYQWQGIKQLQPADDAAPS